MRIRRRSGLNPRCCQVLDGFERLEPRLALAAGGWGTTQSVGMEHANWFQTLDRDIFSEAQSAALATVTGPAPRLAMMEPLRERWLVQLGERAVRESSSILDAAEKLQTADVSLRVLRGLGAPGQFLIETAAEAQRVEAAFAANPQVAFVEPDQLVYGQRTANDPESSNLTGLHNVGQFGGLADADIDAPEAWELTTGSPAVVVGLIDSGIDVTHPDLYLNVWINQGEIRRELAAQLRDVDGDGLYTFYDLNDAANAALVRDTNANLYIDALDLLQDARWADGIDTDENGFADDFFGWNFRGGREDEPFAPNNPSDVLGHGTHVAGTIAAIGNNGRGVTGVAWRASLMSLKFLDAINQGSMIDAIAAMNYAKMMRTSFGVNVPVLNSSWGQSGGYNQVLYDTIAAAGQAEMLLVAAAGNGNILGSGINTDEQPFYPASYDLDNIISVAASDSHDRLAPFSNFGLESVDIAAPGVGILSTLPGGRYGTGNGTSMAAPHVTGAIALTVSRLPNARHNELKEAVLSSSNAAPPLVSRIRTGSRVNVIAAIQARVFAPHAELGDVSNITRADQQQSFSIRFVDRSGKNPVDLTTLDDFDVEIHRQFGPPKVYPTILLADSIRRDGDAVEATYRLPVKENGWEPTDFGIYEIWLRARQVQTLNALFMPAQQLGTFSVQIESATTFYVDSFDDGIDANLGDGIAADSLGRTTLRAAIQEANAAASPRVIIVPPGTYPLRVEGNDEDNSLSGDLDVHGQVEIYGLDAVSTTIDARAIGRIFEVHEQGRLTIGNLSLTGGRAIEGGAIRNLGSLVIEQGRIFNNAAEFGFAIQNYRDLTIRDSSVFRNRLIDVDVLKVNGAIQCFDRSFTLTQTPLRVSIMNTNVSANHSWGFDCAAAIADDSIFISGSTFAENAAGIQIRRWFLPVGDPNANTTIDHSTVSGNRYYGVIIDSVTARLANVTITGNGTGLADDGTGLSIKNRGAVSLANSLVVGNQGDFDIRGSQAVISLGHNLVGRIDTAHPLGGPNDRTGLADVGLGPLRANGGPTRTHALLPGSPAIDAGHTDTQILTDQRGVERNQDGDGDGLALSDIGAFERSSADTELHGVVYFDRNGDGQRTSDEPGLAGRTVYLDLDADGFLDWGEPSVITRNDDLMTFDANEIGQFTFKAVAPGRYLVRQVIEENWRGTNVGHRDGFRVFAGITNNNSVDISGDGRFLVATSSDPGFVPNDNNERIDVFVFDRDSQSVERISRGDDRSEGNGDSTDALKGRNAVAISDDGRIVAFLSAASNLVQADNNNKVDAFVYNRETNEMRLISRGPNGLEFDDHSFGPIAMSPDGRSIAFWSTAGNMAPDDAVEDVAHLFIYRTSLDQIERVGEGFLLNPHDTRPATMEFSADGQFLAFVASDDTATNRLFSDVWLYDRATTKVEKINRGLEPLVLHPDSVASVSISGDGRYVAFPERPEEGRRPRAMIYDRVTGQTESIDVTTDNQSPTGFVHAVKLSRDGRYVAFVSDSSNLVTGDANESPDLFVYDRSTQTIRHLVQVTAGSRAHELRFFADEGNYVEFWASRDSFRALSHVPVPLDDDSGIEIPLFKGQIASGTEFGTAPTAGGIDGHVFADTNRNGRRELWELGLEDWTVYLDANRNAQLDADEVTSTTDSRGWYSFSALATLAEYDVRVVPALNWHQSLPAPTLGGGITVFLDAGQVARSRDFGFFLQDAAGQFQDGRVSGQYFVDENGNGRRDQGEAGRAGVELFLDLNQDGSRQHNEPRTTTLSDDAATPDLDETGTYVFTGLGNGEYAIRSVVSDAERQTSPQGNHFSAQVATLARGAVGLGNPQDVLSGDFNGDGHDDLVTVLSEGNLLSILLADGAGGYRSAVDLRLGPAAAGPIALHAGHFDGNDRIDLAVVNSLTSNVTILRNFNGTGFAARQEVGVGEVPRAITSGDFDGDGDRDLAVVNQIDGTVSLVTNNGGGNFAVSRTIPSGGNHPFDVVSGHFNTDNVLDLAVANFGTAAVDGVDRGNLAILLGNDLGGFSRQACATCSVGIGPARLTVGDLDLDGHMDVAVSNSLSNTISVLQGLGNGTFVTRMTLAAGTGPMDLEAADLDGDGDLDLLVAGQSEQVSILRNLTRQRGFAFEPSENLGVGKLPSTYSLALATGYLDADDTLDLVVTNGLRDEISVLTNTLVPGAHRVELTAGNKTVSGLDFAVQPINRPPTIAPIAGPIEIDEDAAPLEVPVMGISAGHGETQPLRMSVQADRPDLFAILQVDYTWPQSTATIRLQPVADGHETSIVTVIVTDAGIDNHVGTADDGVSLQTFTLVVRPVNDPPIANDDRYVVAPNSQDNRLAVLANDTVAPDVGEALSFFFFNPPQRGRVVLAGDFRSLLYTPAAGFSGIELFSYFVTDGRTPAIGIVTVIVGPGDANHDGRFNSSDFVTVFQAGEYEDLIPENSIWEEGDWNGDGDFTTTDLVLAFQSGNYA